MVVLRYKLFCTIPQILATNNYSHEFYKYLLVFSIYSARGTKQFVCEYVCFVCVNSCHYKGEQFCNVLGLGFLFYSFHKIEYLHNSW